MGAGSGFYIAASRLLAETPFLRLEEVDLVTPDGVTTERQVVRVGGAVAVVAVADGDVLLIRQYRTPLDRPVLELPAGKLDVDGEDPVDAAKRELEEEVGYRAEHLELIARFHTSPGFLDEQVMVYLASGLTATESAPMGAEELAAELVRLPVEDIPGILPEIDDAKTLIGLMSLLLRHNGDAT
mgnify:CR=1 FL=1